MAESIRLAVQHRSECGKGINKQLRKQGIVPGIFYSYDGENIPIQVAELPLSRAFKEVGVSQILELEIEKDGKKTKKSVLIKSLVPHPVKSMYVHVDFFGLDMSHDIVVAVPVELTGKSKGEEAGGILRLFRKTVEVRCKPSNIPHTIQIDVSDLELGENILIEEVKMPAGVEVVFDEAVSFAVVGVINPGAEADEENTETATSTATSSEAK